MISKFAHKLNWSLGRCDTNMFHRDASSQDLARQPVEMPCLILGGGYQTSNLLSNLS
jgi:hypothetical protein